MVLRLLVKMVKIHWSIYLILGIGVLWASYRIDSQKFKLFIWLGYLFLIVGIAKLGIWFVNRKKESPVERKNVRRDMYQREVQQRRAPQQKTIRYCSGCGNGLRGYENFCPMCAQRVR